MMTKKIANHFSFNKFQWSLIIGNLVGCFAYISLLYIGMYLKWFPSGNIWYCFLPVLSIIASVTNLFCILFLSKKRVINFYFGIVAVILFSIVSVITKNYGFALLNVYYLVMNIIGIFIWRKNLNGAEVKPKSITPKVLFIFLGIGLLGTGAFIGIFKIPAIEKFFYGESLGNGALDWIKLIFNAASLTMSVLAMILVSFNYKQQWLFWIVANSFILCLWFINIIDFAVKGETQGTLTSSFTLFTYIFSFVNSIYSYISWKKTT